MDKGRGLLEGVTRLPWAVDRGCGPSATMLLTLPRSVSGVSLACVKEKSPQARTCEETELGSEGHVLPGRVPSVTEKKGTVLSVSQGRNTRGV